MDGMDPDKLRLYGVQTVEYLARYWESLEHVAPMSTIKVRSIVNALPTTAPEDPEDWQSVIKDLDNIIMPGITHWQSPNYFAYFPGGNTYTCICADILSAGIGCVGFSWGTASEALYIAMLVAKDRALKKAKKDDEERGNFVDVESNESNEKMENIQNKIISYCCNDDDDVTSTVQFFAETMIKRPKIYKGSHKCIHDRLVVYTSQEAHSSIEKACLLCSVTCHKLPTDDHLSLRGYTLEDAIRDDRKKGFIPIMIVASLGTTSSVAFDNLLELGKIAEREGIWLHIDAAYAGAAFICPEYRPLLDGVEYAESFNFNPHKWLQINFDCSALWIKNCAALDGVFEVNPEYLLNKSQDEIVDFRNYEIALGRRFRSLKLWFTLRMFGAKAMREMIHKQIDLAKEFEHLLEKDDRFELVCHNILSVICFRLKGSNEKNMRLHEKINAGGKIFITKAMIRESSDAPVLILRFAICSPLTERHHVVDGWKEIRYQADRL